MILARRPLSQAARCGRSDVARLRRSALLRLLLLLLLLLRLTLWQPIIQVIPLVVGSDEGGSDKVGLGSDNEVALWSWVDLPLSHQHVQGMSQNL